ncbi:GH21015 [Drosophila grimshawi]|uniref:GH21015 n=2 Tax=Drosophila grimshawi TaxID=7222 RepID=B4J557_DROGR|nr:GH21015 [Drosophila grimshawi]
MISKPGLLSLNLGLLLIALLSAQIIQAHHHQPHYPYGDPQYSGNGRDYPPPHRPHGQGAHYGHEAHHGHGHDHNQFNNPYPDSHAGVSGQGPNFVGGFYGGGQSRGRPGYGHGGVAYGNGRQHPEDNYGGQQPNGGQRPGTGYERQWPEAGYEHQGANSGFGGQPGAGFDNQHRTDYGTRPVQPRPNETNYENEQSGNPIQPHPQPGGQDTTELTHQQPGNVGSPWQPRPGADTSDQNDFQQQGGNPFQARPQPGVQNTTELSHQQPGNAGYPLQARPVTGSNDSNELQQPIGERAVNTLPIVSNPTDETGNFIQPLPGRQQTPEAGLQHPGNVFQPQPAINGNFSNSERNPLNIEDSIAAIFNTPKLNDHGSRDPKAHVVDGEPDSIDQRNLFETMAQCPEGSEMLGGRCRYKV